jgi:alkanesulfonate monooxygenase SsuD/methylene tetrahydromethanopterin reductase-like flavin-dependent oxidoreductase (luciferase family)
MVPSQPIHREALEGMTLEPRFGLFMSQANKSWSQVRDEFVLADDLGFDHAWLVDHLLDTDGPPDLPCLEAWTLLAAIARETSRVRIGTLVTSNTYRHPSILMKEAVTVDHLSDGRLILGLGAGWQLDEHRRYGIPLPPPGERVDRLEEAIQVALLLMSGEPATFDGRYYRLDDARFEPRPVQQPRIPLLIAAHRPRMIALAARYADQWDTFPEIAGTATEGVTESVPDRMARFVAACRAAGRDPSTVRRSLWADASILESVDAYVGFVERHAALGFTDFTAVLPRGVANPTPVLVEIAERVIPELRRTLVVAEPG